MVATQIFSIFIPKIGEMIQFDEHIFQMDWFNHQLASLSFWEGLFSSQGLLLLQCFREGGTNSVFHQ